MEMYKCKGCNGSGEIGESHDGIEWYSVPCEICNKEGYTLRYVRLNGLTNINEKRYVWLDQKNGNNVIVYNSEDINLKANI